MRKIIVFTLIGFLSFLVPYVYPKSVPQVEVLYVNHGPMQPTLKQIKEVFSKYGDKITVSWYDVDTKEGQQFASKKGVRGHIPLSIWTDGTQTVKLGKRMVEFAGFPADTGPELFQGNWTMADLKMSLDRIISNGR